MATEDLGRKARWLADMREIRELLARYCRLVDSRQPREIARGAFTEDALDDHGIYGRAFRGRDEIAAMFEASNTTTEHSAHFVSIPVVEIEGDVAHTRTYVTGWTWTRASAADGPVRAADWVFTGAYVDRMERTDEGWLIAERRIEPLGPGATGFGRRPEAYDDRWADGARPADPTTEGDLL